ncbi:hypothetical protein [Actinokineospora sp. NBRC 105648]|uniref:hypothetical protein n=1 Tax=Actinokineospora sp. NBRC 105648 TaxID=3032206 RepID=UPI002557678D|nr:hypothetical protein [Actinokineospora sp. NBRC 105648]
MTVYDLAQHLPPIDQLRARCIALAALDVLLSPDRDDRYHDHDPAWSPGTEVSVKRNGGGDEYSIAFTPAGAFVRGFDHESPMSPYATDDGQPWPGVLDRVPAVFQPCVDEPAFADEGVPSVTVCLWREHTDDRWHHGEIDFPGDGDDGADWLFSPLADGTPEAFQEFAQDYYETSVDLAAVRHVYALRPLTDEVVGKLNSEATLSGVIEEVLRTGYPAR